MADPVAMPLDGPRAGVMLVNLGTPGSPRPADVRRYLKEFLSDPRVLDIPAIPRWLLLHLAILPFRPRKSAAAYEKIWTDEGSPLLVHGRALCEGVGKALGGRYTVELAMRYGKPSIEEALTRLESADVASLVILPLFPQAASSSTGSALERVYRSVGKRWNVATLQVVAPFFADPGFIGSVAAVASPALSAFRPDHVLMSYHGLPERQVRRSDSTGQICLGASDCCESIVAANRGCYRAQCFASSRAIATRLGLTPETYSVGFQSRLGRTPWIRPHTDALLPELAGRGFRRLAVLCPSFVADCLETLEEIGIRARDQWRSLGGEDLVQVPCVNSHPSWIETVSSLVRAHPGLQRE